jgi:hypothetical protein
MTTADAEGTNQGQVVVRRASNVDVRMRLCMQRSGRRRQATADTTFERSVNVLVANSFAIGSRLRQRYHFGFHHYNHISTATAGHGGDGVIVIVITNRQSRRGHSGHSQWRRRWVLHSLLMSSSRRRCRRWCGRMQRIINPNSGSRSRSGRWDGRQVRRRHPVVHFRTSTWLSCVGCWW